jgi:hypothetical protein
MLRFGLGEVVAGGCGFLPGFPAAGVGAVAVSLSDVVMIGGRGGPKARGGDGEARVMLGDAAERDAGVVPLVADFCLPRSSAFCCTSIPRCSCGLCCSSIFRCFSACFVCNRAFCSSSRFCSICSCCAFICASICCRCCSAALRPSFSEARHSELARWFASAKQQIRWA